MPLALLVDPDVATRGTYADYLRRSYWRVVQAETGPIALITAIRVHPDMLVTEVELPGMDGVQLVANLKARESTVDIGTIVLTGENYSRDLERAYDAGSDAVLTKPFQPHVLFETIRAVMLGFERMKSLSVEARAQARAAIKRVARLVVDAKGLQAETQSLRQEAPNLKKAPPARSRPAQRADRLPTSRIAEAVYVLADAFERTRELRLSPGEAGQLTGMNEDFCRVVLRALQDARLIVQVHDGRFVKAG